MLCFTEIVPAIEPSSKLAALVGSGSIADSLTVYWLPTLGHFSVLSDANVDVLNVNLNNVDFEVVGFVLASAMKFVAGVTTLKISNRTFF